MPFTTTRTILQCNELGHSCFLSLTLRSILLYVAIPLFECHRSPKCQNSQDFFIDLLERSEMWFRLSLAISKSSTFARIINYRLVRIEHVSGYTLGSDIFIVSSLCSKGADPTCHPVLSSTFALYSCTTCPSMGGSTHPIPKLVMLTLRTHYEPLNSNWSKKFGCVVEFLFFSYKRLCTVNFGIRTQSGYDTVTCYFWLRPLLGAHFIITQHQSLISGSAVRTVSLYTPKEHQRIQNFRQYPKILIAVYNSGLWENIFRSINK